MIKASSEQDHKAKFRMARRKMGEEKGREFNSRAQLRRGFLRGA
jgi:hypothetical protein